MPGNVISILNILTHLSLKQEYEESVTIIWILKKEKINYRKIKRLSPLVISCVFLTTQKVI